MLRHGLGWCLCVLTLCALTSGASAGPLDVHGYGARATSMGGAQVAESKGASALFYNIGALGHVEAQLTAGTLVAVNQTEILLHSRPGGYQVPDLGNDSPSAPTGTAPNSRSDTTEILGYRGLTVGGVTSFGLEKLRAGFLLSVPYTGFVDLKTHFADERERLSSNQLHYEMTGRSLHRFDIGIGAAYRLTPWMSIGVGGMFVPGAVASTDVFVEDLGNQSDVDINADVITRNNWGLLVGSTFDIPGGFRLGLSYRGETYFRVIGGNKVRLGTVNPAEQTVEQNFDWTPTYSPETFSGGLRWETKALEVQAAAEFKRWSRYIGKQSEETNFNDTLSPRLGFEYAFNDETDIRVGGGYERTPVPPQTGRTNYVDNNRVIIGLGAGHRFDLWGQPVALEWALQFQSLLNREVDKRNLQDHPDCGPDADAVCDEVPDSTTNSETGRRYPQAQGLQTGNPGFPGFTSGGWIGALVVDLSWRPGTQTSP